MGTWTVDTAADFILSGLIPRPAQIGGASGIATMQVTGVNGFSGPVTVLPVQLDFFLGLRPGILR